MKSLNSKRILTAFALSIFVASSVFGPQTASAQVIASQYQPDSVNELIAYLYGVIASLEAQKATGSTKSNSTSNVSRADTETLSATSIKKNSATVRSNIDFGTASYVYAYFEYGTKNSVDESTDEKKISKSSRYTHSAVLDDLKTNTTYYYRAVIELPGGSKIYGSLRNFTTSKTTSSSSNDSSGDEEVSIDDSEYKQGEIITVSYDFTGNRLSGSWIGLFKVGSADNQYITWTYVNQDEGEVYFTALYQTGEFEFRLFKDGGYNRVAVSDSFEIN
jgi:hypothetical protein